MKNLVLLLFFTSSLCAYGQNDFSNLRIFNPRQQWNQAQGQIDEVTITVKPNGIYTEVGLYLTISDQGSDFFNGTQLEAVLNFSMPEDVIVNDSWLWVGEDIIKAEIMDRWTASTIYEDIVDRRQDPSILYKNSAQDYELRIYPLIAGSSRKLKLNFLIPNNWTNEQTWAKLPYHLVRSSKTPPTKQAIRIFSTEQWGTPYFLDDDRSFKLVESEVLGRFYEDQLRPEFYEAGDLSIGFEAPYKDGVFLQRYQKGQEQLYELVMIPSQVFELGTNAARDILILVHYNALNTTLSVSEVLQQLKQSLKWSLSPSDRFNIMLAGIIPELVSPDFMPAEASVIDAVFNQIDPSSIASYNLPGLLATGVNYLQEHQPNGRIVLLANSGLEGDRNTANALINDVKGLWGDQPIPIFINDFQDRNQNRNSINGINYYGNSYFYTNLSRISNGGFEQLSTCCNTFSEKMSKVFSGALARIGTMDLYTTLQNGFCYQRYTLNESSSLVSFDQPIRQIGRFTGDFPFIIEAAGELDNEVYLDALSIGIEKIDTTSDILRYGLAGNFLQELEREAAPFGSIYNGTNQQLATEVINKSIEERVLSLFTAFLCLEPAQGGEPCVTCVDESDELIVATYDQLQDSLLLVEVAPNPFLDEVNIEIQFRNAQEIGDYQVMLFNQMGQFVRQLSPLYSGKQHTFSIKWDARQADGMEVTSGIYFLRIIGPQGQHTMKLVKQ